MIFEDSVETKLNSLVLGEPLSEGTLRQKRNLLIVSCASILLTVYGVKVTRVPWAEFNAPANAPEILDGALSAIVLYTYLKFASYAFVDVRRWHSAARAIHVNNFYAELRQSRDYLGHVARLVDHQAAERRDAKSYEEIERALVQAARDGIDKAATEMARYSREYRSLGMLQSIKLVVFDLGIPFGLGILAMSKVSSALAPFLKLAFR